MYDQDMTLDELINACANEGTHVVFKPFPYPGAYYAAHNLIIINSRNTAIQQRCTLAHEYVHALMGHSGHQKPSIEKKVTTRAALLLIASVDYRDAELLYGTDEEQIARELDVTLDILHAYKETLAEIPVSPTYPPNAHSQSE